MSTEYNIEELIVHYLQEEITEEELRVLDDWLQQSSANKDFFFELKYIYDTKRYSEFLHGSEASWDRLYSLLKKDSMSGRSSGKRKAGLVFLLRYVAVAIIAILVGIGITRYTYEQKYVGGKGFYNEVIVDKGGKANTVLLSDGSIIVLNSSTKLRYPTNFDVSERVVQLDGEAYFEVAADKEKPFIVKLKKQQIRVLGTKFNIEAYSQESYTVTTLMSGSVSVQRLNDNGEPVDELLLQPDQKVIIDDVSGVVSLKNIDSSLSKSWIQGECKFKDETLWMITRRLGNHYGVAIHIEDSTLRNIRYTGTFQFAQGLREVLDVINYENQLTFNQTGDNIYIKRKSE